MKNLLLYLLLCVTLPAFAEYRAVYQPPRAAAHAGIAAELRDSQTLDKLAAVLNRVVTTPREIPIIAQSCGQLNAFYDPRAKTVNLCYELLLDNASKIVKAYGRQSSQDQLSKIWAAELVVILLHEVGHSLIDLYAIPTMGREEDAADQFAAFVLLNTNGEQMLKDGTAFFRLNKTNWLNQVLSPGATYGDEHALGPQRTANLVCWGFGKSPHAFADIADAIRLPKSRLVRCADEFAKMNRDIRVLLGSHLTLDQMPTMARAASSTPANYVPVAPPADAAERLDYFKCGACHSYSGRRVGPGFMEIARRYRGTDVEQSLVQKIKRGGSGVWGAVPMPPHPLIPDADILAMVQWVVSQ